MPERFQPRIIASFNPHQLGMAIEWWRENGVTDSDSKNFEDLVNKAFEHSQLDERGRPLDEKGRNRLKMAVVVITKVFTRQMNIDNLKGEIKVWQLTPNPDDITIRWARYNPRSSR